MFDRSTLIVALKNAFLVMKIFYLPTFPNTTLNNRILLFRASLITFLQTKKTGPHGKIGKSEE